eukprot:TRINITY_DN7253_c0_g1_i1.p1 TRINITY_DN7253_c0_g1~~TRINITY_DN7253_c0_g1_i1.p1  ORF type:complete len:164 (-),score=31.71 TRINITY_DN7253_c0_g1_i1:580-1071(-)
MAQKHGAGLFDFCQCDIALWTILLIAGCICLIICTGPYWYYVAVDPSDPLNVAIFVTSAVLLIILAGLGIFAALRRNKSILLYMALVMCVMILFSIVQITLTLVALSDCNDTGSPLHFMCNIQVEVFFAHTVIIIIVAAFCALCSWFLRQRIIAQEADPDNYY